MGSFASRLLDWFRLHGRHDLPWQTDRTPYRVWVSEVMLQQTQVNTVIPYFERFMQSFPAIDMLAAASHDEVMLHWAGLGYYSRARNLHRAAQIIQQEHDGIFPQVYEQVLSLPGIGASTAGAILAQALGQRHAILDGNVKRVLARHEAIAGWPGKTQVAKRLWSVAERHTPEHQLADYTQAIMDLGATVCTRSTPKCGHCPVADDCKAGSSGSYDKYPGRKPKKQVPVRSKRLLLIRNPRGHFLLEKRPPSGIWGGLWSLPELELEEDIDEALAKSWSLVAERYEDLPVVRHTFSHFHLDITPCAVRVAQNNGAVADSDRFQWRDDIQDLALAAPVGELIRQNKLLKSL